MKIIIFLFTFILSGPTSRSQDASDLKKLAWLVGEWNRTNAKPGRSGIEKWIMSSPKELQGWGISMRGSDTTFVEKLKIIVKDNTIYYVADVAENKGVVLFKLIKLKENELVFENPEHDFPKKITYIREGSKLKAIVSGNGKAIDYMFEKKL